MVVDNFDELGIAPCPDEADPPLVIDANAVLAVAVTSKALKMVVRRDAEVGQCLGVVEHAQLPPGHLLDVARQSPRHVAVPNPLRLLASP